MEEQRATIWHGGRSNLIEHVQKAMWIDLIRVYSIYQIIALSILWTCSVLCAEDCNIDI